MVCVECVCKRIMDGGDPVNVERGGFSWMKLEDCWTVFTYIWQSSLCSAII